MEPEVLRRQVWDEMLQASMRANYFAELVLRYQDREKWLRVLGLLASSGAAATVLTAAPAWLKLALPVGAACSSFWLLLSNYGLLARDAGDLHSGWSAISTEYEKVWNHLEDPAAETRFDQIFERGDPLSRTGTKFPNDTKRLEYWFAQAIAAANARYA